MSIYKKIKLSGVIVSIILASIYLTFLVDTQTLNTWLKRAFVFFYFVVVSSAAFYYYCKTKTKKLTLIPLILAVAFAFVFQNTILPTKEEHTVYIQSIACEENDVDGSSIKEAWLVGVEVDGKSYSLSSLLVEENRQWARADDYDDYFFRPSNDEALADNLFAFTVVGNEIKMKFGANTWSGRISVYYYENDGKTIAYSDQLDLYSEDAENDCFEKTLNIEKNYSTLELIIYNAGAVAVFTFVFKLLALAVMHYINKRKPKDTAK